MASWVGSMFTLPAPLAWYPSDPSFHFMSMIQPLSGDNSVFGICFISGEGTRSMLANNPIYVESRNAPANDANHTKNRRQAFSLKNSPHSRDSRVRNSDQMF